MATTTITVSQINNINGPAAVCMGQSITLTDSTAGGVWTSANVLIASVGSSTGVVTGVLVA